MHVILLGGPDHGKQMELPGDQTSVDVANVSNGTKNRYTLRIWEGYASRPSSIGFYVHESVTGDAADKLIIEAIPKV